MRNDLYDLDLRIMAFGLAVALSLGTGWWIYRNTYRCEEVCTYVDRRYDPAHTNTWTTMECMAHNKDGSCIAQIPVTHTDHVPDRWFLIFRDRYGSIHEDQTPGIEMYNYPPSVAYHKHFRWGGCR